jgi:hypothetical protein
MDCPICGAKPGNCYLQCPNSDGYYSPEAERVDAEAFDALPNSEVYAMQMREAGEDFFGEDDYDLGLGELDCTEVDEGFDVYAGQYETYPEDDLPF